MVDKAESIDLLINTAWISKSPYNHSDDIWELIHALLVDEIRAIGCLY